MSHIACCDVVKVTGGFLEDGGEAKVGDADAVDRGSGEIICTDEDVFGFEITVDKPRNGHGGVGHSTGNLESKEEHLL